MEARRYESRGVRCLECRGLEIQGYTEEARTGFGWCGIKEPQHFVSFAMSRNCREFDPAPSDVVGPREAWNRDRKMFWQVK